MVQAPSHWTRQHFIKFPRFDGIELLTSKVLFYISVDPRENICLLNFMVHLPMNRATRCIISVNRTTKKKHARKFTQGVRDCDRNSACRQDESCHNTSQNMAESCRRTRPVSLALTAPAENRRRDISISVSTAKHM